MDSSSNVSKSRNKIKSSKEKTMINEVLEEGDLSSILYINLRKSSEDALLLSPQMNLDKMPPRLGP
jgi:hypothetical protein